jgi:hypothetical protein
VSDGLDLSSARVILAVAKVANLLECFDDLGIHLPPVPRRHADGLVKIVGPAAVFTSILQAAPSLAERPAVARFVDLYVEAAERRRRELLAALDPYLRAKVAAHEDSRSVPASRVVALFADALAGSRLSATVERASHEAAARVRAAADAVASARDDSQEALAFVADLPKQAMGALRAAFGGQAPDEDALARTLDTVVPPETPPGFVHDGLGTLRRQGDKISRNEACPCGSGKKYKKCHGA